VVSYLKIHLDLLTLKTIPAKHENRYVGLFCVKDFAWSVLQSTWSRLSGRFFRCLFYVDFVKLCMWVWKLGSMSQRDGGVNRQHSVETGLTQAIRPMLICASESSVSVRNQQVGLTSFWSLHSNCLWSYRTVILVLVGADAFRVRFSRW